jgi:signal transduction histidine kinase
MKKRFALLRNFSIISLSTFAVATTLLAAFYRQKAIHELIVTTEENNIAITQIFSNTLWPQYSSFLSDTQSLTDDELREHPTIRQLDEDTRLQIEGLPVVKVKVFDLTGRTVFSTDSTQIGDNKSDSSGFLKARSGQVISQLDHRETFQALDSTLQDSHLLSSYIPIDGGNSGSQVVGVFELYTDVTPLLDRIQQTKWDIVLGSLVILAVLYLILFLFVRRADYLIERQYHKIQDSRSQYRQKAKELEVTLLDLRNAQAMMLQSEKMSSLGQMVAGIAHEINNPINFVHGNLKHVNQYASDLLELIGLYQKCYPDPDLDIQTQVEAVDLNFIQTDLPRILDSMNLGSSRIRDIILALRTFARLDEADIKSVDVHQSIESTLMILGHRLKANADRSEIDVIKDYGELPLVECYAGLLNQVFMNLLTNALDALDAKARTQGYQGIGDETAQITITTKTLGSEWVQLIISDNGSGMSSDIRKHIFEPFFTTKAVGQGTGMGLSTSYQIITERHNGRLDCLSVPDQGTEFVIQLPIQQAAQPPTRQPQLV